MSEIAVKSAAITVLTACLLYDEYGMGSAGDISGANLGDLNLVCKGWKDFFGNINNIFPVVRDMYPKNFPSWLLETLLRNNVHTVNKETSLRISSLEFMYGSQNYREMQMFIRLYDSKTWKHMRLPNMTDVEVYNRQHNGSLFSGLAILGNPCSFSYFYQLHKQRSHEEIHFPEDTFDSLAGNPRMNERFIRWILRERPSGIQITMSGVEKLIERNFSPQDIRELVLNPEKYSIIEGGDSYEFSTSLSSQNDMITMACKTYWWGCRDNCLEEENSFSQQNRDEYKYYHRIASNKSVEMHLVWALNGAVRYKDTDATAGTLCSSSATAGTLCSSSATAGTLCSSSAIAGTLCSSSATAGTATNSREKYYQRSIEFVWFVDSVIEENSDVKPFEIYSSYEHYKSPRPYKIIKYR